MKVFKFFGDRPNLDLKLISTGEPISDEAYNERQLRLFRATFIHETMRTLRQSKGFFTSSPYANMLAQHNAFERLYELVEHAKYSFKEIVMASYNKNEFVTRVQVRIPTLAQFNGQLFQSQSGENCIGKTYMFVNFYIGLSAEHAGLLKENKVLEEALQVFKDIQEKSDPAFVAEKAIPGLLKSLQLEPRYSYTVVDNKLDTRTFYQSAEGIIYLVEIAGYNTETP